MTQDFREGSLTFGFADDWLVFRPQNASFYARHFQSFCGGCKETDFVAFDPSRGTVWLIEVKDYRRHSRSKLTPLCDEVAEKTRDVLAMLMVARVQDNSISSPARLQARDLASAAVLATQFRVVLHCALPSNPWKLFPGVKDAANLQAKLKQQLRCVDPHPLFTNLSLGHPLPWTVT